jgi:hypothetical protein
LNIRGDFEHGFLRNALTVEALGILEDGLSASAL